MRPELGVCYYPEHWPKERWAEDAARMVEMGLTWVRIGEFAWSRIEPVPGQLQLDWLDRAIEVLGAAGLKVVLGTPTATPPRWMIDRHPDMLTVDADGKPRKFGSRRHYCFSHAGYLDECVRITEILARRYANNPHVAAWQIDNEYGCHDTTLSYSEAARRGFRNWLTARYGDVAALNRAWGNVFWSMEYGTFDEVDLPNLTVTDPNPSHVLAFRRYSSDQVVRFNRAQAEVLKAHTNAPLIHNYMGRVLEFDHFEVGDDLDIASWDSYPIGFLSDRLDEDAAHKLAFLQQGDPDMQAMHHDLYRAVGRGRWWVMEQQPGPVNWAPYNPAPLPGMVRLWSLEAVAHGAEVVSYFRWRQAPFAQEQYHAGLLQPDGRDAVGADEAAQVAGDLAKLGDLTQTQVQVAILFDYPSDWAWAAQPQGAGFNYFNLILSAYKALRRAGLSVDFLPSRQRDFDGYDLILAPGLAVLPPDLSAALSASGAQVVLGPRSGAITEEYQVPETGRPGVAGLDVHIDLVESLPPDHTRAVSGGGQVIHWQEQLSGTAKVLLRSDAGAPVLMSSGGLSYLGAFPDEALWDRIVEQAAGRAGLAVMRLPEGLRLRDMGAHRFAVNYNAHAVEWNGAQLEPCGVAVWKDGARVL
ncbi:beta-galactosidase [Ruegeria jejuensis]|uniref:beta-galactosidase n=1 Tax=Ruegeria jejuensis TaxID=3233338 RepID=UPI00355BB47D